MKLNQRFSDFEMLGQPQPGESILQPLASSPRPHYRPEFFETIRKHVSSPSVVVELGSLIGEWAGEMLSRFPSIDGLFCVDIWAAGDGCADPCVAGERQFQSWLKRMEKWLYKTVFPCRGTTDFWAKAFPYEIDILYIDANHDYVQVKKDMLNWAPLVRSGGLITGNDYERPYVRKAIKDALRVLTGKEIEPDFLESGPGTVLSFVWSKDKTEGNPDEDLCRSRDGRAGV